MSLALIDALSAVNGGRMGTVIGEKQMLDLPLNGRSYIDLLNNYTALVHGHAHHGSPDGKTTAGIPVHNVALPILQGQKPSLVFRVFDV